MPPRSCLRSRWMPPRRATRMWEFLLPAVILQSFVGNIVGTKAEEIYVIHSEEGNFSVSFNGSHFLYYGSEDYYYENTTYEQDYSQYETPASKEFGNSSSRSLWGPLPFFFSLLHLLCFLLQV
ncbi:uncharacterized protein LOC143829120 [Paroedura picta]|uniref:uncharacterized protein LOC143829120 n=1 Tax=Paroedura picta TaxID=143630 RepID=UPI0040560C80